MSKNIKYCVWDVGNVMYNYSLAPLLSFMKEHSHKPDNMNSGFSYNEYMKGKMSFNTLCRELCDFYAVEYDKKFDVEIAKRLQRGVGEFIPQTKEAIEMLEKKGVINCLLSNALPILSNNEKIGQIILAERRFLSFELGLLKPDTQIYIQVREKLGCEFEEMLFVDDKEKNVNAAQELGINSIVYTPENIINNLKNILDTAPFFPQKYKSI